MSIKLACVALFGALSLVLFLTLLAVLPSEAKVVSKEVTFSQLLRYAKYSGVGIAVTGQYEDVAVPFVHENNRTPKNLIRLIEQYHHGYLKAVNSDGKVQFYLLAKGASIYYRVGDYAGDYAADKSHPYVEFCVQSNPMFWLNFDK
ncbi:MAG: hypothetical protein ACI8WB_004853 [Phenylobacterium sp.]|jgi:hypothetical protein